MPNKHVIFFQPHHQQLVQQGEAQLLLQLLPVDMNKLGGKLLLKNVAKNTTSD